MSTKKITALTELTTTPATGDLFPVVDVSDTTDASSGTTKSIKPATVFKAAGIGAGNTTAEPMTIDTANGKVGIGTTTPGTKLHIDQAGSGATYGLTLGVAGGVGVDSFRLYLDESPNMAHISRGTSSKMVIDGNGKVGVGTTAPTGKMEVEVSDSDNVVGLLVDQNDTTNNPYAISIENAGSGDSIRDDSGAKLTAAGVFTDASDQFRKKNVLALDIGLAEVLRLAPKKFKYKKDNSSGVGFLAQDMEKIIPAVVHGANAEIKDVVVQEALEAKPAVKNNKGEITKPAVRVQKEIIEKNKMVGGKSIAYGSLTAILVKAIQELSAKVTALENA